MRKAFNYRIYLTNGQRRILERQLEECRWLYNETLATRKNAWEQEQRNVNWYETKRALPLLKDVRPSLKLVHSQVLQNVTERVELAFKAFFRRVKAGEPEPGFPRFKGLISMTVAKAEEAGRRVVLVNPRDTSKRCSSCGTLVGKQLSERAHTCPHCGLVLGRDLNAAINILHGGLHVLQS